jgi:hypothetical protein
MANGRPLTGSNNLDQAGYTFDGKTHVLRIRHTDARDISINGSGGSAPPLYVTFDAPHLQAGTHLEGQYPSGAIDWGSDQWRINVPEGAFGTFNLALIDPKSTSAQFRFYSPRIFVGVDVYNGGASEATLTIHSPEIRETSFTIKPGELRRIRTGWADPSTSVVFDFKNGEGLRFDNIAYLLE